MKRIIQPTLAIAVMLLGISCQAHSNPSPVRVYWQHTKSYDEQASRFSLTGDGAKKLLVQRLSGRNDERVKRVRLVVIVDDCYLFDVGPLEKTTVSLTGFYVNGTSGRIEYRSTKHPPLKYGQKPKGLTYDTIELISE